MDPCVRTPDHKYCSAASPRPTPSHHRLVPRAEPPPPRSCAAPGPQCVTAHHAIHRPCYMGGPYPHYTSVTCRKMTVSPPFPRLTSIIRRDPVLARRDPDGFYYAGVVIQEEEHGVFLIEFSRPCVEGERYPAMLQKTPACDIIQHEEALRCCVVPGDNVLAPWEPQLTRYGPGTVILGLETRDPLRAAEDEQLTVSFWNGKKSTVPVKVAVWISPSVHHRIVDSLHRPISSRQEFARSSTTYVITEHCAAVPLPACSAVSLPACSAVSLPVCSAVSLPACSAVSLPACSTVSLPACSAVSLPACSADHIHRCSCHSVHSLVPHRHCCGFSTRSTCCYEPGYQDWWPLSPRTTVYVHGNKDQDDGDFSTLKMKAERSRQEERRFSSSTESGGQESADDESDGETCVSRATQSTMVDSAVNTDSSLWEKPKLETSDRPDWKYWKRGQPEPFYRKPGTINLKNKSSTSDPRAALSDLIGSSNQSALFETISDSPSRRLTMREVLIHPDFNPSQKVQSPPAVDRLGESEVVKLEDKKKKQKHQQKKKIKHLEWEQKREEAAGEKYSDSREAHRMKTIHRLHNEGQRLKDERERNVTAMTAKMAAQEERSERHQTLAVEEKKKEERRLGHLRKVRERIDQKEFEKCAANEQRDRDDMEARRRRVQDHYQQVAERVYEAEQQGGRSGSKVTAEA